MEYRIRHVFDDLDSHFRRVIRKHLCVESDQIIGKLQSTSRTHEESDIGGFEEMSHFNMDYDATTYHLSDMASLATTMNPRTNQLPAIRPQ